MLPRTKQSLIDILALFGGKWWAGELDKALDDQAGKDDDAVWPYGRSLPRFDYPTISAVSKNASGARLSVMMPVFNVQREDWLRACLRAVLDQCPDPDSVEITIVDDASSNDVAQRVVASFHPRVAYVRNPQNLGLVANHNHCIALAKGQFIQLLHQDDLVEPGFYDALLPQIGSRPGVVGGLTGYRYIDENDKEIARQQPERETPGALNNWLRQLAGGQRIQFAALIVRRSAFAELGGFSPSLPFAFDWEMWGRLVCGRRLWYDPKVLGTYRIHENSATGTLSVFSRLHDEMQVAASLLAKLPADVRRERAPKTFRTLLLKTWQTLIEADCGFIQSDQLDFLLNGWATEKEKSEILEGLNLEVTT